MLSPIDGPYLMTTYFWVSVAIGVIVAAVAVVMSEVRDEDQF